MPKYFCHFQPKPFLCLPISNAPDEAPSTDQGTEDPKTLHFFSAEFLASPPLPPACLLMRWLKRTSSYDLQCCLPRQIFSFSCWHAALFPLDFLPSAGGSDHLSPKAVPPSHRELFSTFYLLPSSAFLALQQCSDPPTPSTRPAAQLSGGLR